MYIILDAYLGSLGLSVGFRELKHAHFWDADGNRKRTFRVLRPYCLTVCYTTHLWWSVIVLVWRQVKMENSSLPVAVCVSKTRVLKLPNFVARTSVNCFCLDMLEMHRYCIPLTNRVWGPHRKLRTEFFTLRFMYGPSAKPYIVGEKTRIPNLQYGPRRQR